MRVKSIIGVAVLMIMLGLIISVKDRPIKTEINPRLDDVITLSVTFDPRIRTEFPVRIEAYRNGADLVKPFWRTDSPWNHAVKDARLGEEFFLTAGQMHDGILDCLITHKGRVVAQDSTVDSNDGNDDDRNVACWYKVGD